MFTRNPTSPGTVGQRARTEAGEGGTGTARSIAAVSAASAAALRRPGRPARYARAAARSAFVRGLVGLLAICLADQLVSWCGLVEPRYLPPATTIVARLGELLTASPFLSDIGYTLASAGLAMLVAAPMAVVCGLLLGLFPMALRATRVVIDVLRPLPAVAIIPLLTLTVGLGQTSVVLAVAVAVFWPILLNTVHGVQDVDGVALQTAGLFGAKWPRRVCTVVIPSAAPAIGSGVRIAVSLALVVTVAAELIIGTTQGIGAFILDSSRGGFHADLVYASVAVAGLLGLAVNSAATAIERRAFPWHGREGTS
ncbi:ABC transporter permease [Streptomyces sp. RLB3-17]|uniref:ABC transporter permease n=1 Tax=unclassified Streptomyces TaxID=2593676 RepID=UPI001164EDAA|nr:MULTISPECIES: ABC transporter permease [unclassified Streptomyces]NMI54304.1 ABC transporter permease [Streptomyces sp. RLA2-12]QDN63108.1 ABC transporter permease [Streptomyces sp. S1D4-20]QDN73160.1 ABC transporter permease [Streptomyces sp. S1D4-14]QDO45739.1 ABC transporter permease [Streptomyces sp. RLB3-17]QDO55758.1 ABC transporter permease [Streptomyces sp. RLB3-5]